MKKLCITLGLICAFLATPTLFSAEVLRDKKELKRYLVALGALQQLLSEKSGKNLPEFNFFPLAGQTSKGIIFVAKTKTSLSSREITFESIYTPFGQTNIHGLSEDELKGVCDALFDEKGVRIHSLATKKVEFLAPTTKNSFGNVGLKTNYIAQPHMTLASSLDQFLFEQMNYKASANTDFVQQFYQLVKIGEFSDLPLYHDVDTGKKTLKVYQQILD